MESLSIFKKMNEWRNIHINQWVHGLGVSVKIALNLDSPGLKTVE